MTLEEVKRTAREELGCLKHGDYYSLGENVLDNMLELAFLAGKREGLAVGYTDRFSRVEERMGAVVG